MNSSEIISALIALGNKCNTWLSKENSCESLTIAQNEAIAQNEWFTSENIKKMLSAISSQMLDKNKLLNWISQYTFTKAPQKHIGIIAAGNIPLVFFHDLLCVLLSGNIAIVKLSSKDKALPTCIINMLFEIEPRLCNYIKLTQNKQLNTDAIIATGSDNTLKFFRELYSNKPHIFRNNRTSIAIIKGDENIVELEHLCDDIFSFFGLGCRNVSKLFVPKAYKFDKLIEASQKFLAQTNHPPYANAYKYNKALLSINSKPFIDNKFWLLCNNKSLFSPISVVNYEEYENIELLKAGLTDQTEQIQCIVNDKVRLGQSQSPSLFDYADGIDIMKFLQRYF